MHEILLDNKKTKNLGENSKCSRLNEKANNPIKTDTTQRRHTSSNSAHGKKGPSLIMQIKSPVTYHHN
jgi:hypothetical protein